jgi:ribose transport system permease protein
MGMKNVLWGLALVITGSKSIGFTNTGIDGLMFIGGGSLGVARDAAGKVTFPGIPVSFILVIVVFCIFHVFLTKSALGRQIYCCGGNPEAARLSGIPSKNVLTFVYALSGFMAGMAGVVSVGRLASANGNAGQTYDNDAIAACIVGGASFTGGKGTIWGTLIGAMIMAVIRNGLNLMGASNDVQYIVIGAVIILAVTIDVVRNKMEAKARKMAAQ